MSLDWRLQPSSGGFRESNDCHQPAGRPDGGQFCGRENGPAVGVQTGTKHGNWQANWYSFPEGGAFTADHVGSIPLSAIDAFRPDGGPEQSAHLERMVAEAGIKVPAGRETIYRLGGPEGRSLAGKNGANADGLINFIDRSNESLTLTGNTIHVFAVQFLKPPTGPYQLFRRGR